MGTPLKSLYVSLYFFLSALSLKNANLFLLLYHSINSFDERIVHAIIIHLQVYIPPSSMSSGEVCPVLFNEWMIFKRECEAFIYPSTGHKTQAPYFSSQLATIAVDMLPMLKEEAKKRMLAGKKVEPDPTQLIGERGESVEVASKLVKSNPEYVRQAEWLKEL